MSQHDQNLKPGDIIAAYHKGIHQVVKIERRFVKKDEEWMVKRGLKVGDEYSALIHYLRRLNSSGNKAPNQELRCDASFCTKLTAEHLNEQHAKTMKKADKLRDQTLALLEK